MLKRFSSLLLALLIWAAPALAEVFEGRTAALSATAIVAEASGVWKKTCVQVGQRVEAGEALAELQSERRFSDQDGFVTLIHAREGDSVSGALIEIMPMECYTIYCTVDKAYQSADSTLVHAGETVYVKCTADGTHRAIGVITQIEGGEYRVLIIGGELYVGETVYLYRDEDFTASRRVGIGTVVVSDTQAYEAEGKLTRLYVSEGDYVERGQLLYEMDGGTLCAGVAGIVSSVAAQPGDRVAKGDIIAEVIADTAICVEIQVDERAASAMRVGDAVALSYGDDLEEDASAGTIIDISGLSESELYTVKIRPDAEEALALGMSVTVRT